MNKILLVDGNNVLHRAYHGLPLLKTSDGRYTNAAYGFMMMLQKIIDQEKPTHIAICFDKGKNTFRHQKFPEYKAQRKPIDAELVEQFPLIREVLAQNGYKTLEMDEFEADDIIGTLAKRGQDKGDDVIIFSGDKDLLQMLNEHVKVISGKKTLADLVVTDVAAFEEKYQITPKRLIDLKGLMGDASDNLPGVAGVGEKTALKLLHQFDSLTELYEHIEELPKNKLKEKLEKDKENAFLSKELATIVDDIPLEITMEEMIPQEKNWVALAKLYKDLEFRSLLRGVETQAAKVAKTHKEESDMDSLFAEDNQESLSLFEETNRETNVEYNEVLNYEEMLKSCLTGEIVVLAGDEQVIIATKSQDVAVFNLEIENHRLLLNSFFKDTRAKIISHNYKALIHSAENRGIEIKCFGDDLEIMAYLLDATISDYSMEYLISHYLNEDIFSLESGKRNQTAAVLGFKLYEKLYSEIDKYEMRYLYENVERPLILVLADMESVGIHVDSHNLQVMSEELETKLAEITASIYEYADMEFNINSPKQIGEVLFGKLGLPAIKKTKTGYSTNNEVLENLYDKHPIIQEILLYRQLAKLKSTYSDALEKLISPKDNAIHTVFRQTVTATGRLSSTEPNLQNIPVRLEEGRKIRKAFTAKDKNSVLLAADYSQIELRILSHYAGDEGLISSFVNNEDIHARTAGEIFDVPLDKVDKAMRRKAKAVNFGIIYGISGYGLGRDLGIGRIEAKEYIDKYFQRYPGVQDYLHNVVEEAKKNGYVTTLMGRRRYLPDINHKNFQMRSFAERTAMNTPIQGTAADIIKYAMVELFKRLNQAGLRSKMILQVHDELILDCPKNELAKTAELLKEVMENAVQLKVPLLVDVKTGEDWYSLEKYEVK
ncbi:MAG: DNA polymerase I [Clostridiales bacterium]